MEKRPENVSPQGFRGRIDVAQLDEEASETFVFQEVSEKRPPKRLKNLLRKAMMSQKRSSLQDVMGALRDDTNSADDWVDQIVENRRGDDSMYETDSMSDSSKVPRGNRETEPLLARTSRRGKGKQWVPPFCSRRKARKAWLFVEEAFSQAWIALLALPLTGVSCFFYYGMGNPSPDFLPGNLRLSWLGCFFSRHLVLVATARLIQYLLLDSLFLRSRAFIHFSGPYVTLALSQAKGWPFLAIVWSILSLFLLHGDNEFQMNWLFFTGWGIFSSTNTGGYILDTREYHNCLMGLLVAGIATTVKRTYLTTSYGNRQFEFFRPKLESLLQEVLVVSEIALLSAKSVDDFGNKRSSWQLAQAFIRSNKRKEIGDTLKTLNQTNPDPGAEPREIHITFDSDDNDGINATLSKASSNESPLDVQDSQASQSLKFGESHRNLMKHLLERWEEPPRNDWASKNRGNIADVLRFQRALEYMDDEFPFGDDFGYAPTRAECVSSSQKLFERLCSLQRHPEENLSFKCFDPLTMDANGNVNHEKRKLIRQLFRPDSHGNLDMFSFVQSVDSVYRRLRYFGASVQNDAALDKVLESIYNGFYYFVLGLLLMSMFHFNPWSILVSITSLLVSLSFAFGQTVAQYVQGILTVASTRPFDLGDRIYFGSLSENGLLSDITGASWFVEDICLTNTKLRYASTGEVMYLSNHLIASFRVYNCNRTSNASITFPLEASIKILDEEIYKRLTSSLIRHVTDHPRRWDGVQFIRIEAVDPKSECVTLMVSVRHRNSWQDAPRIKSDKGQLIRAFYTEVQEAGMGVGVPPDRSIIYHGGVLQNGADAIRRLDLLQAENIKAGKAL